MTAHRLLDKWRLLQALNARSDISLMPKVIAARLLDHLNSKDGRCFPSYQTLGKGAGVGRRAAMNAVKQLERKGIVFVRRHSRAEAQAAGRMNTNDFDFDWSMRWNGTPAAKPARKNKKLVAGDTVTRTNCGAPGNTSPSAGRLTQNLEVGTHEERIREQKPFAGKEKVSDLRESTRVSVFFKERDIPSADSYTNDCKLTPPLNSKDERGAVRAVREAVVAEIRRQNPDHINPERTALFARTPLFEVLVKQKLNGVLGPAAVTAVTRQILESHNAALEKS